MSKKEKKKRPLLNRGNERDLILILTIISAFFFKFTLTGTILALVLLLVGSFLHILTKATLIRNSKLCAEGVYNICRNPYYLSNFILDLSFCVLSHNIYLVAIFPFLFFWAYAPTFRSEDELLLSIHKQNFYDFTMSTAQLFPEKKSITSLSEYFKHASMSRVTLKEFSRIIKFWASSVFIIFIQLAVCVGTSIFSFNKEYYIYYFVLTIAVVLFIIGEILGKLARKTKHNEE